MKNFGNSHNQDATDWEMRPGSMLVQRRDGDDHHHHHHLDDGPLIKINVSYGPNHFELSVPAHSTFGYVKKELEQIIGVEPNRQKILFRGKEKEDGEYLHEAGVKDKSKVLLLEDPLPKEELEETSRSKETPKEEIKESEEMSKAFLAIADVSAEIDKLAERVVALEGAVNGGTKVAEDEFVVASELLMRQLLKLDTIEAEGEPRLQRKAQVRRVQNFHDILDNLKARNSKPFSNSGNAVSVTTEWETFDSGVGSLNPPPSASSATRITQDWENFD